MKTPFFVFAILMCSVLILSAQESAIIVLSTKGIIDYHPTSGGTKFHLLPGMKIYPEGFMELEQEAQIKLLNKGETYNLIEKGKYELPNLFSKKKKKKIGFVSRFWDFINDGLINADDTESLDKYHQKYMAVSGGVRGFVDQEPSIQVIMPPSGKIGPDKINFSWYSVKYEEAVYDFTIHHLNSSEMVFKALCRDTSILLDFENLVFEEDEIYYWQVKTTPKKSIDNIDSLATLPDLHTDEIQFEFIQNTDELVQEEVKNLQDYQTADLFTKQWMEAIIMEQEQLIYSSYKRYEKLLEENPENLLIKKLFASFLARQGLMLESQQMIKKCK